MGLALCLFHDSAWIARREGMKWSEWQMQPKRTISGSGKMSWANSQKLRLITLDSFHSLKKIEMTSPSESKGMVAEKADWGWRSWRGTNKYQPFKWHVHLARKVYQYMAGGLVLKALTLSWELSWGGGAEAGGRGCVLESRAIRELNLLVNLS